MEAVAVQAAAFEGWALVELMGHRQRVGLVREVEMFGGKFLRIDIPYESGEITEYYGASALYALRPCSEEIARDSVRQLYDPRPVQPVSYRLERRPGGDIEESGARPGVDDWADGDYDRF
jgi:hypothetical protein